MKLFHQIARRLSRRSNGSWLDLDCSDLTGWSDEDSGNGESTQVTFDGESTFKFDTNAATVPNKAARSKDNGDLDSVGTKLVISIRAYFDNVGNRGDGDEFNIQAFRSDLIFSASFAADGLFIFNGAAWNEVGTNLVVEGIWQEWSFDVSLSGGAANAICSVYLNNSQKASNFDCSYEAAANNGQVEIYQQGLATADMITYLDWFKIGNGYAYKT